MSILRVDEISLALGPQPLLDKVSFQIEPGEKISLIGRNGEGKSTLLKIMAGIEAADSGSIKRDPHIDIAFLTQDLPLADNRTVFDVVAAGLSDIGQLLQEYHHLTLLSSTHYEDPAWFQQMETLQNQIEAKDGWKLQQRIEKIITELNLPQEALMSSLSGGWRRRVGIAQVLVRQPDLLLLDEPTNHLDIDTIQWLEKLLINYPKALVFITHDRALLRKVATRIIEIDRGTLTQYPANYTIYLDRKAKALEEEERHQALFDKKLAKEEVWIRQGIKARRTRNEGRVRALEALRNLRAQRREQRANPSFNINELKSVGKTAIDASDISFYYDKPLINTFSIVINKGDKVALIGQNGMGKTTLVNILIGKLQPHTGLIKSSPTNKIAFFDQNRAQLDPNKTVIENVVQGDDFIAASDDPSKRKHVIGYLSDFLFSPEKCQMPARTLSGGEANRLMLAKLFSTPANVLILDEPTNDLDIESLEMLESLLLNYTGTVIIISHDREFIDNIATSCIAFEGNGVLQNYVGGYTDWMEYQSQLNNLKDQKTKSSHANKTTPKEKTLSKKSQADKILKKIALIEGKMADPNFTNTSSPKNTEKMQKELADLYTQWEALE